MWWKEVWNVPKVKSKVINSKCSKILVGWSIIDPALTNLDHSGVDSREKKFKLIWIIDYSFSYTTNHQVYRAKSYANPYWFLEFDVSNLQVIQFFLLYIIIEMVRSLGLAQLPRVDQSTIWLVQLKYHLIHPSIRFFENVHLHLDVIFKLFMVQLYNNCLLSLHSPIYPDSNPL